MKIETNSPLQNIPGSDTGIGTLTSNRILDDQALVQGKTVTSRATSDHSGKPEIPDPEKTNSVGTTSYGGEQVIDIQQLLMWIATMAAEYIKQQNELLKTRQKAVEGGFQASMDAAQKNYDKNMTQAIVGIVGASVSLAGAGMSSLNLGSAGKELKVLGKAPKATDAPTTGVNAQSPANMDLSKVAPKVAEAPATGVNAQSAVNSDLSKVAPKVAEAPATEINAKPAVNTEVSKLKIDHLTAKGQTWNAAAGGLSQASQSMGGTVSAGQEYDAKADEALAQLIAKTAESITSNEGATRQIIEKFANDLMAMLKNFTASSVR